MRSTSARMRSASSRISTVSSRSGASTLLSSSCAAPRMPDSGFFTSCARIAAMPVTLRAALRNVSCRSSARAAEASCSTSSTAPGSSGSGEPCTVMPCLCSRGLSSVRSWSAMVASLSRTCSISRNSGLSGGTRSVSACCASCAVEMPRNCSAAWLAKRKRFSRVEQHHRHRQRREQRRVIGRCRGAPRPTTASDADGRSALCSLRPPSAQRAARRAISGS